MGLIFCFELKVLRLKHNGRIDVLSIFVECHLISKINIGNCFLTSYILRLVLRIVQY